MRVFRKKSITVSAVLLGLFVLGVTAFFFRDEIQGRYWLWKFENAEDVDRIEILKKIGAGGDVSLISDLFNISTQELKEGQWYIFESPLEAGRKVPRTCDYQLVSSDSKGQRNWEKPDHSVLGYSIDALRKIRIRHPQKSSKILLPYFKSKQKGERWGAALVMLDKFKQLQVHLPKNKLHPFVYPSAKFQPPLIETF